MSQLFLQIGRCSSTPGPPWLLNLVAALVCFWESPSCRSGTDSGYLSTWSHNVLLKINTLFNEILLKMLVNTQCCIRTDKNQSWWCSSPGWFDVHDRTDKLMLKNIFTSINPPALAFCTMFPVNYLAVNPISWSRLHEYQNIWKIGKIPYLFAFSKIELQICPPFKYLSLHLCIFCNFSSFPHCFLTNVLCTDTRVALIVQSCNLGLEEMENLRGNG